MNPKNTRRLFVACAVLAGYVMLACDTTAIGQDIKSQNAFVASPALPKELIRVLVLPLTYDESRVDLSCGCEILDTVLQAELVKTKKFEVVPAGPETMKGLMGRINWTGAEVLPTDFFYLLQKTYGCDAVLFCQLTEFHAYAPLAVGWRMKLVDTHTQKIIWAADQVFDASEPSVVKGAEQFQKQAQSSHGEIRSLLKTLFNYADRQPPSALDDQWSVLNSPRYFGRYSAVQLLLTLPKR